MPTPVQQFVVTVAGLANKLGLGQLVLIFRDPTDRTVKFFSAPGVLEALKPEIAAKLQLDGANDESTTGWE